MIFPKMSEHLRNVPEIFRTFPEKVRKFPENIRPEISGNFRKTPEKSGISSEFSGIVQEISGIFWNLRSDGNMFFLSYFCIPESMLHEIK